MLVYCTIISVLFSSIGGKITHFLLVMMILIGGIGLVRWILRLYLSELEAEHIRVCLVGDLAEHLVVVEEVGVRCVLLQD